MRNVSSDQNLNFNYFAVISMWSHLIGEIQARFWGHKVSVPPATGYDTLGACQESPVVGQRAGVQAAAPSVHCPDWWCEAAVCQERLQTAEWGNGKVSQFPILQRKSLWWLGRERFSSWVGWTVGKNILLKVFLTMQTLYQLLFTTWFGSGWNFMCTFTRKVWLVIHL